MICPDLAALRKIGQGSEKHQFYQQSRHTECDALWYPRAMVSLSLSGKVTLITGGSRGIGAACVRMFVEAGARVVFSYHRARNCAEELLRHCGAEHCCAVQADLSGVESARELVTAAVRRFGRLDVLVVNHGIWPPDDVPIDQMTDEQWGRTTATNLDSVFGLIKYAVAQMKAQGASANRGSSPPAAGHIVVISSTAGQRGEAYHCDYAATKGALISMTKGLSTELAGYGIYVNCVAPGWVDTDMTAPALGDPNLRERALRAIPLGRVGTPEEIAAPVLFLCTEHAGFVTGEVFNVNGGAVLVG
jgi:3-oxoacyl-[acyl-carrier protein] reductase